MFGNTLTGNCEQCPASFALLPMQNNRNSLIIICNLTKPVTANANALSPFRIQLTNDPFKMILTFYNHYFTLNAN